MDASTAVERALPVFAGVSRTIAWPMALDSVGAEEVIPPLRPLVRLCVRLPLPGREAASGVQLNGGQ